MGSVNKAILVGNLGRDAEMKFTGNGFAIARFSIATTDRRKDSKTGDWVEKTEWHRVVLLGKQAESLQDYLKKGKQVYVEGRIELSEWTGNDGEKRASLEVNATEFQLVGNRPDGQGQGEGGGYSSGANSGGNTGGGGRRESVDDSSSSRESNFDDVPF